MSRLQLNHEKIKSLMKERKIRISVLARKMDISRQMLFYIVNQGGTRYAPQLAKELGVEINDILLPATSIPLPKGYGLFGNRVHRT